MALAQVAIHHRSPHAQGADIFRTGQNLFLTGVGTRCGFVGSLQVPAGGPMIPERDEYQQDGTGKSQRVISDGSGAHAGCRSVTGRIARCDDGRPGGAWRACRIRAWTAGDGIERSVSPAGRRLLGNRTIGDPAGLKANQQPKADKNPAMRGHSPNSSTSVRKIRVRWPRDGMTRS
jgi:hypothetical protein